MRLCPVAVQVFDEYLPGNFGGAANVLLIGGAQCLDVLGQCGVTDCRVLIMDVAPTGAIDSGDVAVALVLVDGEALTWESALILDYLDCRYAPGQLFPWDVAE